jgi:hypothetical protein
VIDPEFSECTEMVTLLLQVPGGSQMFWGAIVVGLATIGMAASLAFHRNEAGQFALKPGKADRVLAAVVLVIGLALTVAALAVVP